MAGIDSVFFGPPSSYGAVSSGQVSLGIDIVAGQIYYRSPTSGGWQVATSGQFNQAVEAPSLIVDGATTTDTLSVTSNLSVNGTMTDSQGFVGVPGALMTADPSNNSSALWATSVPNLTVTNSFTATNDAAFNGTLAANTFVGASLDLNGIITIANPTTSQAYVFSTPFDGTDAPSVLLTAVGADPTPLGGIWITNQGTAGNWTGFTVNCTDAPSASATFNYFVIGNQA